MLKTGVRSYLGVVLFALLSTACNPPSDSGGVAVDIPTPRKPTKETYLSGKQFCETYADITRKEFGRYVRVPKDYKNPSRGSLEIYVYSSRAFDANLPTYLFVDGGPGQNTHGHDKSFLKGSFNELSFDQRGLGCSAPATWEEYRDTHLYSTENTIKDMELIRRAYEIKKWSIYGISYGTVPTTMYASQNPSVTNAAVIEGVFGTVDKVHKSSYKFEKLNLVLRDLNSSQKKAFVELAFSESEDSQAVFKLFYESFYYDMGSRSFKNFITQLISLSGNIDQSLLERLKASQRAQDRRYPYAQQPGGIDENILTTIYCKNLGLRDKPAERVMYSESAGFYVVPGEESGAKECDEAGVSRSQQSTYSLQSNLVNVPVYYFQGTHDGATMAEGALEHWRKVPQKESYFMMAQKGGHNPNLTKLEAKSSKLKSAQAELFRLAVSAKHISNDDIDDVNIHSSPANIWKLYLQRDRQVSTGIENDLGGISALEAKVL